MENVGHRRKVRMHTYFQSKNMEGRDHLEDTGTWIPQKQGEMMWQVLVNINASTDPVKGSKF
jgi:hypothetical protein